MSQPAEKRMGVSDARANMTDVIAEVRLLGTPVVLTRREKPQAVLVSVDAYDEAKTMRRVVEMLKAEDADLYEELLAKARVKGRTVKLHRRKAEDDVF
ncbi:type II toxin-antitoxin system Phd/YefM family antitoxin [Streptomyces sp. NBC_00557]|uniref:type II toxin-antitoxin system Phd/YefM family antitoxin n=1 Tax=Streptomyces sp. NBC_00557 TaxID=2975776 RepID=UPI002E8137CB|nr:type II toxin-antitoxin system Phd/YefM family antitoxin [Streptomyces sp. NBC_00557]WUC39645.1 type II toxin-antitoxin system Phd/YefM family antitoxin [Streptomyces sp. NBC_00557]